jgi:[protein-PII] uridylyltransferase
MAITKRFSQLLNQCEQLEDYKHLLEQFYAWLEEQFSHQPVERLVKARAELIDAILTRLCDYYELTEYGDLIAIGGYGRGELHPFSDIDFLFLVHTNPDKATEEKIAQFVTFLWDLRLDIGHSVRTLKQTIDYKKQDVNFATSLLESRLVCGDPENFTTLQNKLVETSSWKSDAFFIAKRDEQALRHKKCHGTSFNLEPNLKENPGGLRDVQTIIWVAKKHFRSQTLQELVEHDYLTFEEHQELLECIVNLWNIRFALHLAAGRMENRLLFDHQPIAAKLLGFGDDGRAAVERMMKRLFRIMARVRELNQMLLSYFEQSILPGHVNYKVSNINRDFEQIGHQIRVKDPQVFFHREKIIELFWHLANNPQITHIYPGTIRLLRQVRRRLLGDLQDYSLCRDMFLKLLAHPNGMGRAFTLMHKHGILSSYLPNWRNIVGQMQFDLFHAYTVDEHTHRLIKNLYHYFQPDSIKDFPLCREIVIGMEKPELLYLAGIFHDIAKGRGGDHSTLGAVDAIEFAKLHKLTEFEGKFIAWLVENHLLMSVTAQRKDINDPDVIAQFAAKVKNEKQLDYLYCLTLADIRATNDNLWNDWKNTLLRELYLHTQRALRRGLENPMDLRDQIRDKKAQAKQRLINLGFIEAQIDALWVRFKPDYFTRFSTQMIAWQCEHILKSNDANKGVVLLSEKPINGGSQVFVYCPEQANLVARLVAVLGSKKANILHAQIMNTKDNYAIDSFVILEQNGDPISSQSRVNSIRKSMQQVVFEPSKKVRIKKNRKKRFKGFNIKPRVIVSPHGRKDRTLVEIHVVDIPGLLTKITDVFQSLALHIHAARITTIGERAEDFFVVSNHHYNSLTEQQSEQLQSMLLDKFNSDND